MLSLYLSSFNNLVRALLLNNLKQYLDLIDVNHDFLTLFLFGFGEVDTDKNVN